MENKHKNPKRALFALVLFSLMISCNSGKEKENTIQPDSKMATVQIPNVTYDECDTLASSPNYLYGYIFERKDSINIAIDNIVCLYYDHYNEVEKWEKGDPYYSPHGIGTYYAFPKEEMDKPIKLFEINGMNNCIETFGKQIGDENEILRYNHEDNLNIYRMYALSSFLMVSSNLMVSSGDTIDTIIDDYFVVNVYFGYLKQNDRYVFHRSYILDLATKACLSVGEYVCPFYRTNASGDIISSGQIYAERGFGGLSYGYIYMDRTYYLGWSTKLQENNPELNSDIFPYDIPNKSWSFGELDSKSHKPISMFKGNEAFVFDYDNNVISHFLNNRLTEFILYDDELDDPRIWNIEHHGAKVVEYEFGNNGGLWRRKYWSRNGKLYMPVTINENEDENSPREVYRAEANSYSDTKVVRIDSKYNYDNNDYVFFILELDEITGLYNRVATIQKESDLKPYILKKYLDW